jgi:hypothetical protein
MSLLPLFQWVEGTGISVAIRGSFWVFAVVQALHLVTLSMLAGSLLIVDLRLLGRGVTEQPLKVVAQDAQPWLIAALFGMLLTGVPQLISNATKEYNHPFFRAKMGFLLLALLFTFTLRRNVTLADAARVRPVWRKAVGIVSITLWLGVAISGRLIGLFS